MATPQLYLNLVCYVCHVRCPLNKIKVCGGVKATKIPTVFAAINSGSPLSTCSCTPSLFLLCFHPLKKALEILVSNKPNQTKPKMPYNSCTSSPKATDCWDFLQNATNTSRHGFKQTPTNPPTLLLSTRGLEMCTEILGSESGSCIDPITTPYSTKIKPRKTREILKKTTFPPPLTSITSGYGVRVESHRGAGRLLITVVASSSTCRIYLKSERENGRLRVFLHKDYYRRIDQQLAENIKQSGRKIRRNFKCGDATANKNLTSLPLCVALT